MGLLIEKPEGDVVRDQARARIEVREREHWSQPVIPLASEEVPFLESTALGPRMESGIRWFLKDEDFDRVKAGLVCPQCLTGFPTPALARNIAEWRRLAPPTWSWGDVTMRDRGLAAIMLDCCPICSFEQSPEMLALQEQKADRHTDAEWDEHVGSFDERADAYFARVDREKRSTGFKPQGGFLSNRPVRSAFDQVKGG